MPIRLSAKKVAKVLAKNGFVLVSQSGSHQKWKNAASGAVVAVPFHGNKDLSQGTLYNIIRSSKIDKKEFGF